MMIIIPESLSVVANVLGVLLFISFLKWLWKILNIVWFTPKSLEKSFRKQGLVGNSYRFLIGDMKEMSQLRGEAMETPMPFVHDYFHRLQPLLHQLLSNSAGSNCYTWMGPVPTILVRKSVQIKEGFNRMNEFRKPKLNPLTQKFSTGLVNYEGHKWAKHRKILNPAFHLDKLKLMIPSFEISVTETLSKWEKIVSKTGSSEIDVWPYFMKLSADAISRAAFGSSFEDGRKIFELLTEQKELIIRLIKYSYIPGWKYLPTKGKKRMDETDVEIKTLLKMIINNRKQTMKDGDPNKDDILGILLDSNSKETLLTSESKSGSKKRSVDLTMSFLEVIDECKLFYIAGQETTSVLLTWTMALLGKHKEWQTRAREEVLATFGMNIPDFDGLNNRLKTVTMILYEVLRLYPPVVATSRRVYDGETKLGDLVIPPGVAVSFSILHAHLDSEVWGIDAKEFKPERFVEGIAKATKGSNSYFPFGWGPRICIGQNFALTEAKMALSMILQRFSFEIAPSYAHAPSSFIALQPQHGVPVILHKL